MDDERIKLDNGRPSFIKDPDTGKLLPIDRDRRYLDIMTAFWDGECQHPSHQLAQVQVAGGALQLRRVCKVCGEPTGNALSKKSVENWETLPVLDGALAIQYKAKRRDEKHDSLLKLARTQLDERGRFTLAYQSYLQSPEWERRRRLVLKRCGEVCEGCGEARATQVHHITYENFGAEFLFELMGLCRSCHERLHALEEMRRQPPADEQAVEEEQ